MSNAQQQTRAIATRSTQLYFTIREEMSLTSVADVFIKSGLFTDTQSQAAAMVKVLAGREMDMEPVQAMMGLYIVHNRLGMYAEAMAAKIKADPDMRYKVLEHTDEVCSIEFFERIDGAWDKCGPPSTFTAADAKRAGTQNMPKFPRNMLFARAMSNGFGWYCPHLKVPGIRTPEELETIPADEGPSAGAQALNAALEAPEPNAPKAVEQAPVAPEEPPPPDPEPAPPDEPYGPGEPTAETKDYQRLAAAYKAHLGEDPYHGLLAPYTDNGEGKSNTVPEGMRPRALQTLHTACVTGASEDAPFPDVIYWTEACLMKKPDLLEGIQALQQGIEGVDALRTAYLGEAPDKALQPALRVYHAALSELVWEKVQQQASETPAEQMDGELFGTQ